MSQLRRPDKNAPRRVAIVGGGFSGTLLAINLLRYSDVDVLLLDGDSRQMGRGLAYGTDYPEHVLNVRASNMSAFADDLDHFSRWLGEEDQEGANRFVPRRLYGRYLGEQLRDAHSAAIGRLTLVNAVVTAAERGPDGEGWRLSFSQGDPRTCDILVLAQGNMAPSALSLFDGLDPDIYLESPWGRRSMMPLSRKDHVLLIGAGLTAVDVALSLDADGFHGHITSLSRRGLHPRAHALVGPHVAKPDRPGMKGAALIGAVRKRADSVGWRAAIDELRPFTSDIWRSMGLDERRRFLRHLRPYWDVHRHRLAPAVDRKISAMQMDARLTFAAGKIVSVTQVDDQARVEWRVRGTDVVRADTVRRIINCTGPSGDLAATPDPLLRTLLANGEVRQDPLKLGLDVDRSGQVLDRQGRAHRSLLAVGPMTRAESWEIVAVPDIRRQVWDVARRVGNAQWVGGEGL